MPDLQYLQTQADRCRDLARDEVTADETESLLALAEVYEEQISIWLWRADQARSVGRARD